ncbi:hypothetical protein ACLB2K_027192 [Fragaria x ananassa]
MITYNTLVDGFVKAGRMQEAEKLFSRMLSCGQLPDVQTYAILLDGLCSSQQLSRAMELLREMEDNKMELNIVIYTIIIKGMCKARRLKSATDFFSNLSSKGVVPNVRTHYHRKGIRPRQKNVV